MTTPTVEKRSLGVLSELGDGGEGRVYQCSALTDDVYKEFRPELAGELDRRALERTIALLTSMSAEHRSNVERRTAWPHTVVTDQGRFVGFLMPRVRPSYFCRHGVRAYPGTIDCRWDILSYRQKYRQQTNIISDSTSVSEEHVLDVMLDLAQLAHILHHYKVVLGDISGRNLLWSIAQSDVMVIDCDGFRLEGDVAVTRPKQTPHWIDPIHGTETCLDSDRYKIGLAMFRAYFSAELGDPTDTPPAGVDAVGASIHALALRCVGGTDRPTAADWVSTLQRAKRAETMKDRPVVDLEPTERPRARVQPTVRVRPNIKLD